MKKIHSLVYRFINSDLSSLFVRIALGVAFAHAGWLKVTHMPQVLQAFEMMGFWSWLGYVVAYSELIAGTLILLGAFVRYAALVIAIIMLVATFGVHIHNGFGMQANGFEYPFVLFFLAASLLVGRPDNYTVASLTRLYKRNA